MARKQKRLFHATAATESKLKISFPINYVHHTKEKDFIFFRFATEKLRKSHIERIHQTHKGEKSEICEFCAKTFSTRKEVSKI